MTRKSFRTLAQADKDFDDAIDYYLIHASEPVAERFVDALSAAYAMIRDNPEIGAPRLGESIGRPALRTWTVRGFPYVVCYECGSNSVEVWRVLHAQSDIPNTCFGRVTDTVSRVAFPRNSALNPYMLRASARPGFAL